MKTWRPFDWDECPECGEGIEIKTDCTAPGQAYDGDAVRCSECGYQGIVVVTDDYCDSDEEINRAYVSWIGEKEQEE